MFVFLCVFTVFGRLKGWLEGWVFSSAYGLDNSSSAPFGCYRDGFVSDSFSGPGVGSTESPGALRMMTPMGLVQGLIDEERRYCALATYPHVGYGAVYSR